MCQFLIDTRDFREENVIIKENTNDYFRKEEIRRFREIKITRSL
jgi:hypothetical protein